MWRLMEDLESPLIEDVRIEDGDSGLAAEGSCTVEFRNGTNRIRLDDRC